MVTIGMCLMIVGIGITISGIDKMEREQEKRAADDFPASLKFRGTRH